MDRNSWCYILQQGVPDKIQQGEMMVQYRDHRGSLVDSMATVQEFKTRAELIAYLRKDLAQYNVIFDDEDVIIEPYWMDDRIGWDTWIITIKGIGVMGFTDGNLPKE